MTDSRSTKRSASHRRRKRAAWHRQADGAVGEQPPPVLEHALVPGGPPSVVEDGAALGALVERMSGAEVIGFDTEFIGEETFRPRVCLVQVATEKEVALVDPLALEARGEASRIRDLHEMLASPDRLVVVHAAYHDVEAMRLAIGRDPEHVVDTQVAAAMCGLPWPASLATVLEQFTGHRTGKAHTFTDWDARPLSPTQCLYAADDVRYLPLLWHELGVRLDRLGRRHWALEESADRLAEAPFDPRSQVKRIARGELVGQVNRAIVTELVLERYAIARDHDVPPRGALPDATLAEIARARPADVEAFRSTKGVPGSTMRDAADRLVAAVARGVAKVPVKDPVADSLARRRVREAVDRAWPCLQERCGELGIATELVVSRAVFSGWFGREVLRQRGLPGAETLEARPSPFEAGSWRDVALGDCVQRLREEIVDSGESA
ncbi:MAG: ribonuclease D [Phycisphaerales bacterium]|jgi:ribonuclease D